MPEFVNPFSGKVPDRKLTHEELIRAIRLNIAAEHEAIYLYCSDVAASINDARIPIYGAVQPRIS